MLFNSGMASRSPSPVWPVVHSERRALLQDLEPLQPEHWRTPSLCPGWDVHDVLAHVIDSAKTTRLGFIRRMIAARMDFDRDNAVGVEREKTGDPEQTLSQLGAVLTRTSGPPASQATRLVEAFVHGEDIRRPLGISRDYPPAEVATALGYQVRTTTAMGGGKEIAAGWRLVATDTPFEHGEGPEVRGPAISLLLAVSGRPVADHELSGPGAPAFLEARAAREQREHGGKKAALQSSVVHAGGLSGKIHWTEGTPAPDPDAGPRPEPAYILVHGIGVSHRYLARLHAVLAASAPTYSLDLPGFGGTPKPGRRLSVEEYGEFIAEALKSCGIHSYVLVGHSMGAQFVIEAALHAPERAQQVVLMGPVVDSRHKNIGRQSLALTLDGLIRESPSSNWIVTTDYLRCGPRWYLTELKVMMKYPTEKRLANITVPVLILRGSRDNVAGPDWALRLSRAVAQGRLVEIPGVGHVAQHMRPKAVADAIRSFVSATSRHS